MASQPTKKPQYSNLSLILQITHL